MSAGLNKGEIITLKVDEALLEAMAGIQNRSSFIRSAILSALGNICPLCNGVGTLTASQKEHWDQFAEHHHLDLCSECQETHVICDHEVINA